MKSGMDSMNATSIVALRCTSAFIVCVLLFHKCTFRINRDLIVRAAVIGAIMAGVFVATIEPPRLHAPAYPQEAMAVEPKRVS